MSKQKNKDLIRTIIIDDEKLNIKLLSNFACTYCPEIELVATATNYHEGLTLIQQYKPDLLFLDIEINDKNGFDLLQSAQLESMHVVMVTGHKQYASEAFNHEVTHFLLKPLVISQFMEAVKRVQKKINLVQSIVQEKPNDEMYIALPISHEAKTIVSTADIIRLEAMSNYTKVYTTDGKKHTISKTLKDYEKKLPHTIFIRVHHSHIINIKQIHKYIPSKFGNLVMCDNVEIPISATYKKEVMERIQF